ncbi:MAG: hypothetical protein WCK42_04170 [Myxococcaceae bacterium]
MRTIALRDLQQKGLKAVNRFTNELLLLESRAGPAYFLIPVQKTNLETQSLDLERAMAFSNLHNWQQRALELGLDQMTPEEINQEINATRKHNT